MITWLALLEVRRCGAVKAVHFKTSVSVVWGRTFNRIAESPASPSVRLLLVVTVCALGVAPRGFKGASEGGLCGGFDDILFRL